MILLLFPRTDECRPPTKRTFFNHFADKRDVRFAGAQAFEASIGQHLTEAGDDLDPIDSAVAALTRGGFDLAPRRLC